MKIITSNTTLILPYQHPIKIEKHSSISETELSFKATARVNITAFGFPAVYISTSKRLNSKVEAKSWIRTMESVLYERVLEALSTPARIIDESEIVPKTIEVES
jgi:hypothetical protein